MNLESLIYLAYLSGRITNVSEVLLVLFGLGLAFLGIAVLFQLTENGEVPPALSKSFRIGLIGAAVLAALTVFVPTSKTVYAIVAVSLSKEAAATETGKRLLEHVEQWVQQQLPVTK